MLGFAASRAAARSCCRRTRACRRPCAGLFLQAIAVPLSASCALGFSGGRLRLLGLGGEQFFGAFTIDERVIFARDRRDRLDDRTLLGVERAGARAGRLISVRSPGEGALSGISKQTSASPT